jgi:hypothetical protein
MDGPPARPPAEETRPDLTFTGHAWRLVVCLVFGLVIWSQAAEKEWSVHQS